ncbi:polysaccharide biosynthesis protein [Hellea balneolensis]|uniref:polysaccharide biosynthesis protein n=1 Tax=Hellea balneolensis TaxID=287478 RepID=UPI000416C04F|nr:polysaccharide biosynthesis protein [Hellea balneolensis]
MSLTRVPWLTKTAVVFFDAILGGLCMYGAIQWRYDFLNKTIPNNVDENAGFVMVGLVIVLWVSLGVHRAIWRFTSISDIRKLLEGVFLAVILTPLILFLFVDRAEHFPRSAPLISGALFFVLLCFSRLVVMLFQNGDIRGLFNNYGADRKDAILIGSGASLYTYLRDSFRQSGGPGYNIRGLIETDDSYQGRSIRGVPVLGNLETLPKVYARLGLDKNNKPMLLATDVAPDRAQAYQLVKTASEIGAPLARIARNPGEKLSPFEAADLIGREARALDIAPVKRLMTGRRVMVTGAGGSIGSELSRQIAALSPAKMILVDNSEYNLYKLDQLMQDLLPDEGDTQWGVHLGDVCDVPCMEEIFKTHKPEIILHAAAFKHVPLGETNPIETLKNNVGGTKTIIDLAVKYKAKSFTLVSTDKAVDPSNIMGASKRIVELLTMASEAQQSLLSASAVRFGNVLASAGSVVPLFEDQIAMGGPVTVTHKDVNRYFMTTEEAAALVLQAAALNANQSQNKASVFVLEMGEPVNITRLARQLIRLRGFVPDRDIKIEYTDLRDGEKMSEALTGDDEILETTYVKGVMRFTGDVSDPASMLRRIDNLLDAIDQRKKPAIRKALKALLPDYEPNGGLS